MRGAESRREPGAIGRGPDPSPPGGPTGWSWPEASSEAGLLQAPLSPLPSRLAAGLAERRFCASCREDGRDFLLGRSRWSSACPVHMPPAQGRPAAEASLRENQFWARASQFCRADLSVRGFSAEELRRRLCWVSGGGGCSPSSRTLPRSELVVGRSVGSLPLQGDDLRMGGLCPESLLMAADNERGFWLSPRGPWRRQAQPSLKACSLGESASSGWKPAQRPGG